MRKIYLMLLAVCFAAMANGQITVTNPGNTTPGLAATYADLATAITALNAQTAISGPVTIAVDPGNPQTAPNGGYTINPTLTGASSTNTVTLEGNGNTITASAALTAGVLHDAIFEIIGSDYMTIQNFTMLENPANTTTTAGTNNMTEFGVALFYLTTTNGAQNITIQNNTITLNRTYQNTWGIYSNSTHTSTVITTTASATTTAGGNSGLKVYGNTISNVNQGICVVGPTAAADMNTGLDIGGTGGAQANSITNWGTTGTFSGYVNVSGTLNCILVRNATGFNVSYNTLTSSVGGNTGTTSQRAIFIPAFSVAPAGTFTNTINNNSISVQSGFVTGTLNGIINESTTGTATSSLTINNNNFHTFGHTVAASGACTFINSTMAHLNTTINFNTFTAISLGTTGSTTFISNSVTVPAGGSQTINSNSIVTSFSKTGAGGTITGITTGGSSTTVTSNWNTNTFSNITVTGATTVTIINNTDGGTVNHNIIGNTISNITGGTSTITAIFSSFGGQNGGTGNLVSGNTISNITGGGTVTCISIGTSGTGGLTTVTGNTISAISSTGASVVTGITSGAPTNCNILRNKIYDLSGNNAGTTVNGITVSSGVLHTIYNNLIGDLRATAAVGADVIRAVNLTSTTLSSSINVYYNSIYLNASSTGLTFGTSGIFHTTNATATTAALTLRNNIIVNNSTASGTGIIVCYRRSSTTLTNYTNASNNNDFYSSTGSVYFDGTTAYAIAGFKALVTPRETSSFSEDPEFQSTTGSSADFLKYKVTSAKQIESGAVNISGITDDYIGTIRQGNGGYAGTGTAPDIGAWELEGIAADLTGPAISYTALANTLCTTAPTLTPVTITDASGVNTTAGTRPRMYYRKGTNTNAWNDNTNGTDGWKYVEATGVGGSPFSFTPDFSLLFGGVPVATDVIHYFIVAQDNAGTPNVGINSGTFAATPSSVALTGAAFPIGGTPSSYTVIGGGLSGSVNVGPGETYLTLTAAGGLFAALNAGGLTGNLTANITGNITTEDGVNALNALNYGCAGPYTLTIKAGGAFSVSGSNTGALIRVNAADYVTIDGSTGSTANTVCPASAASRDLTITNTNTGTSSAVVWLQSNGSDGATNNTVKNCNIEGSGNTQTLIALGSGSSTISTTSLGTGNNNNSFVNNNISKTQYGIYSQGASSASKNSGNIINQNLINTAAPDNVARGGIWTGFENNLTISGNNISGMTLAGSPDVFGISLGQGTSISTSTFTGNEVTNAAVTNNVIGSVTNTGTFSAHGISVTSATSGTNLIANNMISGVGANGTGGDYGAGIFVGGGSGSTTNIFYNSVSMIGTFAGGSDVTAGIAIGGSDPIVNLRNNIVVVTTSTGANENRAIALAYSTYTNLTSDNNDLYVTGTTSGIGYTGGIGSGTIRVTLADWQTATGKDAASKNVQPTFSSLTNLHLVTPDAINFNNLESFGSVVSVTNDIDCETRPNGSAPDIGADEFVGAVPSVDVSAQSINGIPSSSCPNASVPITVSVKNETGTLLDFSTNPMTITLDITGASTQTLTATVNSGTLAGGATQAYSVSPNAVLTAGGTHNFSAVITALIGESSTGNNTVVASKTIDGNTSTATPYAENFAAGTSPAGWTTTGWSIATTHGNTNYGLYKNLYSGATTGQFNLLKLGPIGATDQLIFDYRLVDWSGYPATATPNSPAWGSIQIQVSTDCGGSYSTFQTIDPTNHTEATTWATKAYSLAAYAGQEIYIRFLATWTAGDWFADFDNFNVTPPVSAPSCTSNLLPTNGSTVTNGSPVTLSWNAAPTATSYDVYLEMGTNPPTILLGNVAGTSTSYTPTVPSSTYYWYVVPKNSGGSASGCNASTTNFVTDATVVYCTPAYTTGCTLDDFIQTFTLKGESGSQINETGGTCTASYVNNYSTTDVSLERGYAYAGSILAGTSGDYATIWIDFNDDGNFTATERLLNNFLMPDGSAPAPAALYSILIPSSAPTGSHRMRVRLIYSFGTPGSVTDPCNSYTYGQTKDYKVTITSTGSVIRNVSPGTPGTCIEVSATTIDAASNNNSAIVPILDANNDYVAFLYPDGNNLGRVNANLYAHNSAIRNDASSIPYLDRNFNITVQTAPTGPYRLRYFYTQTEFNTWEAALPGSQTQFNLVLKKNSDACVSAITATPQVITQSSSGTFGASGLFTDFIGVNGFSGFYLGSTLSALPVNIISFSGYKSGSINKLQWTTSSEQNNVGFDVQRSLNGVNYTSIGFVNTLAPGGNSATNLNYNFTDNSVAGSKQFYRLRQVDIDNRSRFSNVVLIKGDKPTTIALDGLFPNPASSVVNVLIAAPSKDKVTILITDMAGRTVTQQLANVETGSNTIPVDISRLTNGTYMVKLVCSSDCTMAVGKFVKQ